MTRVPASSHPFQTLRQHRSPGPGIRPPGTSHRARTVRLRNALGGTLPAANFDQRERGGERGTDRDSVSTVLSAAPRGSCSRHRARRPPPGRVIPLLTTCFPQLIRRHCRFTNRWPALLCNPSAAFLPFVLTSHCPGFTQHKKTHVILPPGSVF